MNYAVLLSGGVGTRLGLSIPKQYYEVNNKPIIWYTLQNLEKCDGIAGIVIVAAEEWRDYINEHIMDSSKFIGFAMPGENRQLSIYNGLCSLRDYGVSDDACVLVQDAARPSTSEKLIQDCLTIPDGVDGLMPVLPMKDTIYLSKEGKKIDGLLNREELFAGQAPESFRFGKYMLANEALLPNDILRINGSTEPAILAGMNIGMVSGEEGNYKITTEADLKRFCERTNK